MKIITIETPWDGDEVSTPERDIFYCCRECGEILSNEDAARSHCPKCRKTVIVHVSDTKKPVNINRAHWQEIQRVTGLGASTARKIELHRKERGPFQSIEGLLSVHQFGPKRFEAVKDKVRV